MIVAPAGTPKPIVERLHAEVKAILELPDIKAEFARTGRITVGYPSVEELQRFVTIEIARLGKVVERAGIAKSQ
jgi:tripartite-type tricarboxylate transporter receptor subunit TctC